MLAWLMKWWGPNKDGSAGSKTKAEEPIHAELGTGSDTEEAVVPPSDQFLDDQPITGRLSDRFNRAPFASRLAHTLAQRADPSSIVVGLYGPWGDGKTSVLEMMEEVLKEYPRVILVRFNPWHFQSQDALLRGGFTPDFTDTYKKADTGHEECSCQSVASSVPSSSVVQWNKPVGPVSAAPR